MMCISLQLCTALVTIDVKATTKPWNILKVKSSFFKEAFLTKDMKSITMEWVCEEVSNPFYILVGTISAEVVI